MSTSFNVLDLIFFVFTLIFVLTAFFRGFVKEIFSLLNWIVALTLSYLITPFATDFLAKQFEFTNLVLVDGITRSVIFVTTFIITALSTKNLRDSLEEKIPNVFNRSLGVLFGFIKTLLIFGFIYSLYFHLYAMLAGNKLKETIKEPAWMKEAKCHSLLKFSGDTLDPIVKKFFESISRDLEEVMPKEQEQNLDEKIDEIVKEKALDSETKQAQEIVKETTKDKKTDSKVESKKIDKDTGYNKKDIEKMNHLIDIIDK